MIARFCSVPLAQKVLIMKIVISPRFRAYEQLIRAIPGGDYTAGKVFCDNRNTVFKISMDGQEFVVKKYARPTLFNCFVYTFFRQSKAKRAYRYAKLLLRKGVETAAPVAYIEERRYGFFHTGYFISEYLPYPTLNEAESLPADEQRKLGESFVEFTAHIHQAGILHKDYNRGNILYHRAGDGRYRFALVDINRFRFGRANIRDCMNAFNQLGLQLYQVTGAIVRYSTLRHMDADDNLLTFLFLKKRSTAKIKLKRTLKSFFGILS